MVKEEYSTKYLSIGTEGLGIIFSVKNPDFVNYFPGVKETGRLQT